MYFWIFLKGFKGYHKKIMFIYNKLKLVQVLWYFWNGMLDTLNQYILNSSFKKKIKANTLKKSLIRKRMF